MSHICVRIKPLKTRPQKNEAWAHNNVIKSENGEQLQPEMLAGWINKPPRLGYASTISNAIKKLREDKKMEHSRARAGTEIQATEMIISGSPEWFRDQSKLPAGWRNWDDDQKANLWKKHPPMPEKVQQFKDQALKMLGDKLAPEALANVLLHTHETTPHIQAILLPIPKPVPGRKLRMSYEQLFGQAKGKKAVDGFKQWQDWAGEYFGAMGLERGKEGSLDTNKQAKQWKAERAEINTEARAELKKIKEIIEKRDLVLMYGQKVEGIWHNAETNKKIRQAHRIQAKGYDIDKLTGMVYSLTRKLAKTAKAYEIDSLNNRKEVEELKMGRKVNSKVASWAVAATKRNPTEAKKVIDKLRTIAEPPTYTQPAQSLNNASRSPTASPISQLPTPKPTHTAKPTTEPREPTPIKALSSLGSGAQSGGEPELWKAFELMTEDEKLQFLRAKDQAKPRAPRPR